MDYNLNCHNRVEDIIENPFVLEKAKEILDHLRINWFRILRIEKEHLPQDFSRGWINIYYELIGDKTKRPHLFYISIDEWDSFHKPIVKPVIKPITKKRKGFFDKLIDSIFSIFK